MSDSSQGPGTTTVMEPPPPGGPPATGTGSPQDPPPTGGIPVWVIVAVTIAVAAVVGTGVFIWQRSVLADETARITELELTKAQLEDRIALLEKVIASATAIPTVTPKPVATTTVTPPKTTPPKVVTTKQLALVKKVTWSSSKGYQVTADYVQMLTGQAAADAAAAAGEESPPPNDYFIVNSSAQLRTLALPKTTAVYILGWGGAGATTKTKIPVGQFMDIMPGGANPQNQWKNAYWWLTVKNGTTITLIEHQYLP